jgi:hypothetical protein
MLMITTPCDDSNCGGTVEFDLPPAGRSGKRLLGRCDLCGAHFTLWGGERTRLAGRQDDRPDVPLVLASVDGRMDHPAWSGPRSRSRAGWPTDQERT